MSGPNARSTAEQAGVTLMRERLLTTGRPKNGRVESIRPIKGADGLFRVLVRVSWRDGEHLLTKRDSEEVKRYKSLSALEQRCRETYRFKGPIIVETDNGN